MKFSVAFVCVHNSCRSQIAQALAEHLAGDVIESYSAGTEIASRINPVAVRLMKEIYDIDMEATQFPKTLEELPEIDVLVTMGCNVQCPTLPCQRREDWGWTILAVSLMRCLGKRLPVLLRKWKSWRRVCVDFSASCDSRR